MGIAQRHGAAGEALAAAYLELIGYTVAQRNRRIAGVEVDLIARDGSTAVLVEVKTRARSDYGGAALAVDRNKRERLMRAARAVATVHAVRVDVIAIELSEDGARVRHVRNALAPWGAGA